MRFGHEGEDGRNESDRRPIILHVTDRVKKGKSRLKREEREREREENGVLALGSLASPRVVGLEVFFLLFLSVGFETRSQLTGFDKGVRHAQFWFGFYYLLGSVARVTRARLFFFLFGLLSGLVDGSIWNVERNGSDKWNDENCVGGAHDVRTDAPVDSIFFLWIGTVDLGLMLWTAWNGRGE